MPRLVRILTTASLLGPLVVVALAGCDDHHESARRTWTPADHSQPPDRQLDPSRMPARPAAEVEGDPVERAAAALFVIKCASCHGRDGRGGGPELPPGASPPDFTDAAWQAGIEDETIAVVIRGGGTLMPAFGEEIPPAGIEALIGHLRRLGAP